MPTIVGQHRIGWGPRNRVTLADRSRLVECTTWSGGSAGTDRSLLLCALAGISGPSRASAGEEVLVLDERAELTPRQIVDEKLTVALHTSQDKYHRGVNGAARGDPGTSSFLLGGRKYFPQRWRKPGTPNCRLIVAEGVGGRRCGRAEEEREVVGTSLSIPVQRCDATGAAIDWRRIAD